MNAQYPAPQRLAVRLSEVRIDREMLWKIRDS